MQKKFLWLPGYFCNIISKGMSISNTRTCEKSEINLNFNDQLNVKIK